MNHAEYKHQSKRETVCRDNGLDRGISGKDKRKQYSKGGVDTNPNDRLENRKRA